MLHCGHQRYGKSSISPVFVETGLQVVTDRSISEWASVLTGRAPVIAKSLSGIKHQLELFNLYVSECGFSNKGDNGSQQLRKLS